MAEKRRMSRNRSANFTINEKTCLFTLVSKYKVILENKKTDALTNQRKLNTWRKVAREFNYLSPENVQRPAEVLKRFYENKKKQLRKRCASSTPVPENDRHPSDDLLLSIISENTVNDINPPIEGDIDSAVKYEADEFPITNSIEVVYDEPSMPDEAISDMEFELVNIPELKSAKPPTRSATSPENIQKNKSWDPYTPSEKISSPFKRKFSKCSLDTQEENEPGPSTIENTPTSSFRICPSVVMKSPISSDIASKYDKLLDCRRDIASLTKIELEQRIQQNRAKHEKEIMLLDIQLEIEREKLKRIKRSDYLL